MTSFCYFEDISIKVNFHKETPLERFFFLITVEKRSLCSQLNFYNSVYFSDSSFFEKHFVFSIKTSDALKEATTASYSSFLDSALISLPLIDFETGEPAFRE